MLGGGGSGREEIYPLAIAMFKNKPLFGYDPMGFLCASGIKTYPHNIFLELLLDYGIIGTLGWLIFFYFIVKNYIVKMKYNNLSDVVALLFISNFIELLVSGSFMANYQFWFFIGYGVGVENIPKIQRNKFK